MIARCDVPRAAMNGGADAHWPGKLRVSYFSEGFVCFDRYWSASRHVTVEEGEGEGGPSGC